MYQYEYPHPSVSTDIVIFTIQEEQLKVLLIRRLSDPFKNGWALPGGFVEIDEDLEQAANAPTNF
ncbi:MAG: NUDIX hydrolase [Gammaproteobacteria bacterium]|nr:NUDIX hydrolase [Gammaproteobacteria bacterium]